MRSTFGSKNCPMADQTIPEKSAAGATPAPSRWRIVADRLLAQPQVRINSPQLSGSTKLLKVGSTKRRHRQGLRFDGQPDGKRRVWPGADCRNTCRNRRTVCNAASCRPTHCCRHRSSAECARPSAAAFQRRGRTDLHSNAHGRPSHRNRKPDIDGQARSAKTQPPSPATCRCSVTGDPDRSAQGECSRHGVTVSGKPAEVARGDSKCMATWCT